MKLSQIIIIIVGLLAVGILGNLGVVSYEMGDKDGALVQFSLLAIILGICAFGLYLTGESES